MAKLGCGCTASACHCGGTSTAAAAWNRPGLDMLRDRVGTHGTFLEAMKARLPTMELTVADSSGEQSSQVRPLAGLTTRDAADPAIALLDGWATIADVLTFYQERISNESYLRTARERRSLVSLARTVGYVPRPGVAASTFLWYTIDPAQTDPVVIPEGTRAQSIPGPGELPQSFETSEAVEARSEWNALAVRQTRPQRISRSSALHLSGISLAGAPALKTGESILFVFDDDGTSAVVRTVASAETPFGTNRTAVTFVPLPPILLGALPLLQKLIAGLVALPTDEYSGHARYIHRAEALRDEVLLGGTSDPSAWAETVTYDDGDDPPEDVQALVDLFAAELEELQKDGPAGAPPKASPDTFVAPLLKPPAAQPASAGRLPRDLRSAFAPDRDASPQLLLDMAPQLRGAFYQAWANASVVTADPPLRSLHVFRTSAAPFGAMAPFVQKYEKGELRPPTEWTDWSIDSAEADDLLYLDASNDAVIPGSFVLTISRGPYLTGRRLRRVLNAEPVTRSAYGLAGRATRLTLAQPWWDSDTRLMSTIRATSVRVQTEPLTLDEETIPDPIASDTIELSGLYKELQPGSWLVISGERADIPGVDGINARELAMLAGLTHGYDPKLPGDVNHTTLLLATKPAYSYKRSTVVISANVVRATHGETRVETLGAGDASRLYQSFALKQPPLTFVPAISAAGVASTLSVLVDDVEWQETDSLIGSGAQAHHFVTRSSDDGAVSVVFGDGVNGARTPTGVENIRARYRQGIGKVGNVKADQVSLLLSRPPGVRSVTNPLPATGGADQDGPDLIRRNTPLAVAALDRVVSVKDYADFAQTFAGIAKAASRRISDGVRQYVHVTIAGVDDVPIDTNSAVYSALVASLQTLGDPALPLVVARRERITLVLSAGLRLSPGHQWEVVSSAVRAALLERFGFERQSLAQAVATSAVVAAIQNVPGIDYVDIDAFGGVPERTADGTGARRLLTLHEISEAISAVVSPGNNGTITNLGWLPSKAPGRAVIARRAGLEAGMIRPAELAIFTPAVPDTIVLNQIR